MEILHSGPSTERMMRAAFVAVLINAFGVWFLWDGYIGYPRENARALAQSLGVRADAPPIDKALTRAEAKRLLSGLSSGMPVTALVERFGSPALRNEQGWYYLGPGGHVRVTLEDGRVMRAAWSDARHSETDLSWQRWIGAFLLLAGLAAVAYVVYVCSSRISVTPSGLRVTGRGTIPFDAIVCVRGDSEGGHRVVVEYIRDGRRHFVSFDRYRVRRFDAIASALCQRFGPPNSEHLNPSERNG